MKCSLVVAGFQQYYAAYIISSHSICDGSHICVHYISSDGAALWCRRRLLQDFLSASTCLQDQTNPHLEHLVTLNDFPVGDVPYKTLFVFVFCFCFILFFLGGGGGCIKEKTTTTTTIKLWLKLFQRNQSNICVIFKRTASFHSFRLIGTMSNTFQIVFTSVVCVRVHNSADSIPTL